MADQRDLFANQNWIMTSFIDPKNRKWERMKKMKEKSQKKAMGSMQINYFRKCKLEHYDVKLVITTALAIIVQ